MTATRFTVPADVLARRVGDETVILHLQTGLYFGLNEVGADMWDRLSAGESLTETEGAIAAAYEVETATVHKDLHELIATLVGKGLLSPAPE